MVKKAEEILSYLDYTSLSITDNPKSIARFLEEITPLLEDKLEIAGVCVYPSQINEVNKTLKKYAVKRVVVGCGFPDSQILLASKIDDAKNINRLDVDEVDIVINVGLLKMKEDAQVLDELKAIRAQLPTKKLKVIIESALLTKEEIKKATTLSILGGADFVKTSTGKNGGATLEDFEVMCKVVAEKKTDLQRSVGLKVSGGVKTLEEAWAYRKMLQKICGDEYLNPNMFRIGASSLLKDLKKYLK